MLTQAQKIALRRHLGVPFAGTAQAGRLFGWRFEIHVEDLEYRMNNMQPAEEQLLTGNSMGSYALNGAPTVGDTLTYTVTDPNAGALVANYTVTSQDLAFIPPGERLVAPSFSIALNSALKINQAAGSHGYSAAGVQPADLLSPTYLPPYFAELIVTGPKPALFTLAVAASGTTNATVEAPPTISPVNVALGPVGNQTTLYGYLAICDFLAMQPATENLSLRYDTADVVKFRRDAVGARNQQYRYYCEQLSKVMGGEQYIRKFFGGGGGGASA